MIQRIQSVYLLIVLVLGICLFPVPFSKFINNDIIYTLNIYGLEQTSAQGKSLVFNTIPIIITSVIFIILTFLSIFKYKNRKLQIKIGKVNIVLQLLLISLIILYSFQSSKTTEADIIFRFGSIIPIINIILILLVNKAISKDEELRKSANRIR